MNRLRLVSVAVGVLLSIAPAVFAEEDAVAERAGNHPPGCHRHDVLGRGPGPGPRPGERVLPVPDRVHQQLEQGHHGQLPVFLLLRVGGLHPGRGFYRTTVQNLNLPVLGSFVQDDFIDYLNTQGLLQPGANAGSIGTLLVTFNNLPTSNGYEANVVARTYNRLVEADATQGTVGFAYNASLFFDSADTTLVGFARDTKSAPTIAGKLRSNIGIATPTSTAPTRT